MHQRMIWVRRCRLKGQIRQTVTKAATKQLVSANSGSSSIQDVLFFTFDNLDMTPEYFLKLAVKDGGCTHARVELVPLHQAEASRRQSRRMSTGEVRANRYATEMHLECIEYMLEQGQLHI